MAGRDLVPPGRSRPCVVLAMDAGAAVAVEEAEVGWCAPQPCALQRRIGHRHGVEQQARIGMAGAIVDSTRLAHLDDMPAIHDRDLVSHFAHDGQVVSDEQIGELEFLLQRLEQRDDLRLGAHVEGRDRLVADDEIRIDRQRPGNDHALALPAREFVRVAAHHRRVEMDELEQFGHPLAPLARRHGAVDGERLGEDRLDRHARMQARIGVLQHELHMPPHLAQGPAAHRRQLLAAQPDRALMGLLELQHGAAGGRLAGAGLADQPERFAWRDGEGDPFDGLDRLATRSGREQDGEVADLDERRRRHRALPAPWRRGTASSSAWV